MGETCGLFLSCLPHPPTTESPFGPPVGLPMKKEIIGGGLLFFAPPSAFKIKQNRFLHYHSPLLCGLGMEVELGDNQFITETRLGQWLSVGPLAPGELHSPELQGNRDGHWVSPKSHTFGPRPEGFWKKGLHSIPGRSPHCFLSAHLPATPTWISIKLEEVP